MAIINCPECHGKISSTVKQCLHCGAKITVCPECEKVFVAEVETCTVCGYAFSESKVHTSHTVSEEEGDTIKIAKQAKERWISENPLRNLYNGLPDGLWSCLLSLVEKAIFILLFVLIWQQLNDQNFLNYSVALSNVKMYTFILAFLEIFTSCFMCIGDFICYNDFSNWAKQKQLNMMDLINNSFSVNFSKQVSEEIAPQVNAIQFSLNTEIYDKNVGMRSNLTSKSIIKIILDVFKTVFLTMFFLPNAEIYMQANLLESDILGTTGFEISMVENWWLLIIWGALVVVDSIYSKISDKKINEIRRAWMDKHMPENVEKYIRYIECDR